MAATHQAGVAKLLELRGERGRAARLTTKARMAGDPELRALVDRLQGWRDEDFARWQREMVRRSYEKTMTIASAASGSPGAAVRRARASPRRPAGAHARVRRGRRRRLHRSEAGGAMNATRSRWARGDSVAKKTASKKKQKKCWSQSVGEYGFTVRIFELYPNSNLYRSIWVEGREDKKSLGHKDREKAISQAHELITHLRATEGAVEQDRITLGVLLVRYLVSEAHAAKGTRARTEDAHKLRRVVEYLGSSRLAVSLGAEDVRRFTRDRKAGTGKLLGGTPGNHVGDRTAEADLVALRTMLNWARGAKNAQGVQLLSANPRALAISRPSL